MLRFMAYNFLTGGRGDGGERTDALISVVERARPDVLGVCEADGFDSPERLARFCDALGMDAVVSPPSNGSPVALLHKRTMNRRDHTVGGLGLHHGFAGAVLDAEGGPLFVLVAHLHPFSSGFRAAEAEVIAAITSRYDAAVVMGDLNSVGPSDLPIEPTLPRRLRVRLSGRDGAPDVGPIRILRAAGLREVGPAVGTYPTALDDKRARYGGAVRLDHVLVSEALFGRVAGAEAIGDATAQRASDHLPVLVELAPPRADATRA